MSKIQLWLKENILYIAWLQAIVAVAGSLFFSEVLKFAPCILCWYQRICLYPLVVLIPVGIIKKDKNVALYTLPLTIIGILISIYHNLLYFGVIPEAIAPCTQGVSCTTKYINIFGFISIPLLALAAFVVLNICLIYHYITHKTITHEKRS